VDYSGSAAGLRDHLKTILRKEDGLMVLADLVAAWQSVLVSDQAFKTGFERAA
jgi:hypothetical protein